MRKIRCISMMLMSVVLSILALSSATVGIYPPIDEYDSFADISSPDMIGHPDGKIDIYDVVFMAMKYGTTGNPQRNVTFVDPIDVNVTNWPYEYPCYPVGICNQEIVVFSSEALLNPANPVYRGGLLLDDNSDFAFLFQPIGECCNVTKAYLKVTLHNIHATTVQNTRFSVEINNQTQEFSTAMVVGEQFLTEAALPLNSTLTDTIQRGINTMKLSSEGWQSGTGQWYPNHAYEVVLLVEYEC